MKDEMVVVNVSVITQPLSSQSPVQVSGIRLIDFFHTDSYPWEYVQRAQIGHAYDIGTIFVKY